MIIANDLGLENQAVRSFIREHPAFFKSADRWDRLKKWATPEDREDDLAVKMMAVLARAEQPDLFAVLIKLYEACCHQDRYNESKVPKAWDDIRKMGLEERFWKFAADTLFTYDPQALQDVMTFEAVEKRIISALRDAVIENSGQSFKQIRAVINRRLDGYWAGAAPGDDLQANRYQAAFHALEKATRLFDLRKTYDEGMSYARPKPCFRLT